MKSEFHLRQGPNITGPFTLEELQRMLLRGEIQRDTPCRQGISGHWLTVYDHVPSAHWGRSIMSMQAATAADEKPRQKTRSRLPFLIISILCGVLVLFLLAFLIGNLVPVHPVVGWNKAQIQAGGGATEPLLYWSFAALTMLSAWSFVLTAALILSPLWLTLNIWMLVILLTREPPSHDKVVDDCDFWAP